MILSEIIEAAIKIFDSIRVLASHDYETLKKELQALKSIDTSATDREMADTEKIIYKK